MSSSKKKKKTSIKKNPFLQGYSPLEFDNINEDELLALTDEDAARIFLSNWMERFSPLRTYKKYISSSEFSFDILMKHVREGYIRFVIEEEWNEEKYEMSLDSIFVSNKPLAFGVIEKQGELYEKEQLPMQIIRKRQRRRGK